MALKSTVYKATLNIADMDREYYANHSLTLACHPSETEERLMLRIFAFVMYAHEDMGFGKGLSEEDEPDLWQKDLTDQILHWIDLGQPDETRIRKGSNRGDKATVLTYGDHSAPVWWSKIKTKLTRFENLNVIYIPDAQTEALASMVERSMDLQITIEGGHYWVSDASRNVEIIPETWMAPK